jgi:hypothetical protein
LEAKSQDSDENTELIAAYKESGQVTISLVYQAALGVEENVLYAKGFYHEKVHWTIGVDRIIECGREFTGG